eukprot:6627300-Karenia_brevis.AAC.1
MATKDLVKELLKACPSQKFYIQKQHDEEFACIVQHEWMDVARVTAQNEFEKPEVMWAEGKVEELAFDKDQLVAAWQEGARDTRKKAPTRWCK